MTYKDKGTACYDTGIVCISGIQIYGQAGFHENMTTEDALETLSGWILHDFRQAQIRMQDEMVTVLVSKKGKATVRAKKQPALRHRIWSIIARSNISSKKERQCLL